MSGLTTERLEQAHEAAIPAPHSRFCQLDLQRPEGRANVFQGDVLPRTYSEPFGTSNLRDVFPNGTSEADADLVVFIDPIDGTEFVEARQGGWSLISVYDRREDDVIAAWG